MRLALLLVVAALAGCTSDPQSPTEASPAGIVLGVTVEAQGELPSEYEITVRWFQEDVPLQMQSGAVVWQSRATLMSGDHATDRTVLPGGGVYWVEFEMGQDLLVSSSHAGFSFRLDGTACDELRQDVSAVIVSQVGRWSGDHALDGCVDSAR